MPKPISILAWKLQPPVKHADAGTICAISPVGTNRRMTTKLVCYETHNQCQQQDGHYGVFAFVSSNTLYSAFNSANETNTCGQSFQD